MAGGQTVFCLVTGISKANVVLLIGFDESMELKGFNVTSYEFEDATWLACSPRISRALSKRCCESRWTCFCSITDAVLIAGKSGFEWFNARVESLTSCCDEERDVDRTPCFIEFLRLAHNLEPLSSVKSLFFQNSLFSWKAVPAFAILGLIRVGSGKVVLTGFTLFRDTSFDISDPHISTVQDLEQRTKQWLL